VLGYNTGRHSPSACGLFRLTVRASGRSATGTANQVTAMDGNGVQQNRRALAEIESAMLKAEEVFTDADTRCKQAERDRRAALDTINKHQAELDDAVGQLRQRSVVGSKWRVEMGKIENALPLQP